MSWLRLPAVAGQFYPGTEKALRAQLDVWFQPPAQPSSALGLMVPHAGYRYSGALAASAYADTLIPDSVLVLCPNHTGEGERVSIWDHGTWTTPLGKTEIDEDLAREILSVVPLARSDKKAHVREHAIEVHLPFLQYLNPAVQIVPVVLGALRLNDVLAIGQAIASVLAKQKRPTLLVASTDMSHYVSAIQAAELDALALANVRQLSPSGLYDTVRENNLSMCGFIPTTCTLEAALKLGAKTCEFVGYSHSGEVSGDHDHVVGYAAARIL